MDFGVFGIRLLHGAAQGVRSVVLQLPRHNERSAEQGRKVYFDESRGRGGRSRQAL